MLVLKHMAREINVDPYKLRRILRPKFGKRRSWRWSERNRDYERVLAFAAKTLKKKGSRGHG